MKLSDKKHWGDFIYGLIYPGFVGSMIYELIPQTKAEFRIDTYFTIPTILKIAITLFYSLDYLHLYGDMHNVVKEQKRNWTYLLCDVFSSLFFFLTFVTIKVEQYGLGLFFISVIPFLIFFYKKSNRFDRYYHIPYFVSSIAVGLLYLINWKYNFHWVIFGNVEFFLLIFVLLSFLFYTVYVFFYYELFSKAEDKRLYGE